MPFAATVEEVARLVEDVCQKKIAPETSLVASDLLDSIAIVDLTAALEEKFEIRIPQKDVKPDHFESAAHIHRYLVTRLG